jgi:Trypsin-like peptidase domain
LYLQSYVLPVCLIEASCGVANIRRLCGSAFLIGTRGVFLTARHVLEVALIEAERDGLHVAIIGKGVDGTTQDSTASVVQQHEYAPQPFDVAVGISAYSARSLLTLQPMDCEAWKDVATFGYPTQAVSGPAEALNLNLRCHKGYVQRLLIPGDLHIGQHPKAFETSFLIGRGMSGAPLFVHAEPQDIVIGVCVGSARSEVIEDEVLEVQENGTSYKELKLKIEQFGIAHNIGELLDWKPAMLSGRTLQEASCV